MMGTLDVIAKVVRETFQHPLQDTVLTVDRATKTATAQTMKAMHGVIATTAPQAVETVLVQSVRAGQAVKVIGGQTAVGSQRVMKAIHEVSRRYLLHPRKQPSHLRRHRVAKKRKT